jgi:hypothetical protein
MSTLPTAARASRGLFSERRSRWGWVKNNLGLGQTRSLPLQSSDPVRPGTNITEWRFIFLGCLVTGYFYSINLIAKGGPFGVKEDV